MDEFADLNATEDAEKCPAHQSLSAALKLRAQSPHSSELARIYKEVIEKFQEAYDRYGRVSRLGSHADRGSQRASAQRAGKPPVSDVAVDILMRLAQAPLVGGTDMLETATAMFRKDSSPRLRETDFWTWLSSMNNLGCALTMLGQVRVGIIGIGDLEEAVSTFRELLSEPVIGELPNERAMFQVNLATAFEALADMAMPAERLRYLESAVECLATALSVSAPERYKGLTEMWVGVSA